MKKHIPNCITCCNLISGCIATAFAFGGNLEIALVWIIIGAVFDFFDGMVARLLHVSSPIGKELLLAYAFKNVGYKVTEPKNRSRDFDLCLEKNGKKYVVEIKSYKGQTYLHIY